jgi:hypothetical protein
LADGIRWIGRLVRSTVIGTDKQLKITQNREVILDDGWTRICGPSVESGGWCEIQYLRIPWVEEAKARAAAGLPAPPDRLAELRGALAKDAVRRRGEQVQGKASSTFYRPRSGLAPSRSVPARSAREMGLPYVLGTCSAKPAGAERITRCHCMGRWATT